MQVIYPADTLAILKSASGNIIVDAVLIEINESSVIWRYKYSDPHYETTIDKLYSINGIPFIK